MAKIIAFSDLNGKTVELVNVFSMSNKKFQEKFPGVVGKRYDSFSMQVGVPAGTFCRDELALPVTRKINYKAFPSKHICDARCMNATGKTMQCECSCGGKNHGVGSFNCE